MILTLGDGRTITCPLSDVYGPFESTQFDSDVYYHHSILIDEIGLVDGTEIRHVQLGRDGSAISAAVHPEKWSP